MAQIQIESNNQSRIPVMKKSLQNQNSQSLTGGSRLEKMQTQFQKKLVKEKEEKLIQMYEDNQQRTINKVIRNSGKGLVRDFFRERRALEKMTQGGQETYVPPIDVHFRQKKQQVLETETTNTKPLSGQIPTHRKSLQKHSAGRDRSHPLAPIEKHNGKGQNINSPPAKPEQKSRLQQPQMKRYSGSGIPSYQKVKPNDKSNIKDSQQHYVDDFDDNSGDTDQEDDDDDSANGSESSDDEDDYEPVIKSKMPTYRIPNLKQEELLRLEKEIEEEEEKLQQEQEVQLQLIKEKGKIQNHHMNGKQVPQNLKNKDKPKAAVNQELIDEYNSNKEGDTQKPERMPTPEGLVSCSICGRHFAIDRIEKHSKVCEKTSKTKRKVFDPVKMRTQGTEMEQFRRKINKNSEQVPNSRKSNWRNKHESFIESIRQARAVQKHLAAGGKLSDLAPPPPSENPDYIQCPHCQRRFNSDAAERHIPKCQNIGTKPPPAIKNASKNSKMTKTKSNISKHK